MVQRVVAAILLAALSGGGAHPFSRTEAGEPVKDFTLATAGGQPLTLSKSLGAKATLVVFWASWSPRSAEILDDFQKLYDAHRGQGLGVVAVNVEHQEWDPADGERLAAFVAERGIGYPVVYDQNLAVFSAFGVMAVPSSVLVDGGGTVVDVLDGYANTLRVEFRERVLSALGLLPAAAPAGPAPGAYLPKGKAARYLHMGQVLLERGMAARAEAALRKALEEDPEYGDAHEALAAALDAEGKTEEAAAARARAREAAGASGSPAPEPGPAGETDPAVARHLRMAQLLLDKGMAESAESVFRKVLTLDPRNRAALAGLARSLEAGGKAAEASEVTQRLEALGPERAAPVGGDAAGGGKP
ncbi:MAG: TlpA disulfide reductase family protein [Deferrisomatales bacterium]